jgi:hypothetical protein
MSEQKPASATFTVNLETGDFYFTVPADFDYSGPGLDIVDSMLSSIPTARRTAA